MSQVAISGNASGTGTLTIAAPNTNSNYTLTLPQATTTLVGTDATQTLTNKTIQGGAITSGTSVASTSGTSIDFTGLPAWVKKITVLFNEVSGSGTSIRLVQLGTGSTTYTTSGYLASTSIVATTVNTTSATAGFNIYQDNAAYVLSGHMVITNISGNIWVSSHTGKVATTATTFGGGSVTLGAVLTAVRITTVNGTDTFDAGSINILYEG